MLEAECSDSVLDLVAVDSFPLTRMKFQGWAAVVEMAEVGSQALGWKEERRCRDF